MIWGFAILVVLAVAMAAMYYAYLIDCKKAEVEERTKARRDDLDQKRWDDLHNLCMAAIKCLEVQQK